eukprot:gene25383-30650_t
MEVTPETKVTLVSNDNEKFSVSVEVAKMSALVRNMLPDEDDEEESCVPLPNVNSSTLSKVLAFCLHYLAEPMTPLVKPLQDSDLRKLVQEYYVSFITSLDNDAFYHITSAANYLDIRPLLDLCCALIASKIHGKSIDEIRRNFNLTSDRTEEEEQELQRLSRWADDL